MPEFGNRLDINCLELEAFYALIEEVVTRLQEKNNIGQERWISDAEAIQLLHISSKTTLQKYRDEGSIRFTQSRKKTFPLSGEAITTPL
ncbi:MAG: DNA-binding protein [Saprospiraceae bacterium]|nr:DNA-binding protein [Saprospiraceae bacterium]